MSASASALTPLTLRVRALTRETADAVTVHLEDPTGRALPPYRAGQYLTLILPVPDPATGGRPVRRAYSLSSAPHETPGAACAVTVKETPGGLASTYIVRQLQVGQALEVLPPLGSFTPETSPTQRRQYVLVGGGSGITPLLSILKTVLHTEPLARLLLVYANRDRAAIIFDQQLTALAAEFPHRLTVAHVLETGAGAYTGRFSAKLFADVLQDHLLAPELAHYYLCGPAGLMQEARTAATALGVPADRVRWESFTAPATAEPQVVPSLSPVASPAGPVPVKIKFEGKEYTVAVEPKQTILEAGLAAGIDLPYSCQAGLCTACRGRCQSGAVRMDEREGLSDSEIAKGFVLLCVGHPTTSDVVIAVE